MLLKFLAKQSLSNALSMSRHVRNEQLGGGLIVEVGLMSRQYVHSNNCWCKIQTLQNHKHSYNVIVRNDLSTIDQVLNCSVTTNCGH